MRGLYNINSFLQCGNVLMNSSVSGEFVWKFLTDYAKCEINLLAARRRRYYLVFSLKRAVRKLKKRYQHFLPFDIF